MRVPDEIMPAAPARRPRSTFGHRGRTARPPAVRVVLHIVANLQLFELERILWK